MPKKMPTNKELSPKKRFSQVFFRSEKLVNDLVERSSIGDQDLVVEIGPGEGIITEKLAQKARRVMAIEKDPQLCQELQNKFRNTPNVEIRQGDALEFEMPDESYKVFANPPFAIEGRLVRKLVNGESPPNDTYLVMRRGVARRMAGIPKEGQFSVLHKPRFEVKIFHDFNKDDFRPKPLVSSSMISFEKREKPLVSEQDQDSFEAFVRQGFGGQGRRIKQKLAMLFSPSELNQIAQEHGFGVNDRPTDLTFDQWLGIFDALKKKSR